MGCSQTKQNISLARQVNNTIAKSEPEQQDKKKDHAQDVTVNVADEELLQK